MTSKFPTTRIYYLINYLIN